MCTIGHSAIYYGCTPSAQEPAIESFRLVAWDNANDGQIDQESGIVHVRHISSGEQVMNVDYTLSNGSEITPDPTDLDQELAGENQFHRQEWKQVQRIYRHSIRLCEAGRRAARPRMENRMVR